jgi:outer membrane protein W
LLLPVFVATTAWAAPHKRHHKHHDDDDETETAAATPVDDDAADRAKPDKVDKVTEHESVKPAHHTELYFRAGVASVDPRMASGGFELEPSPLAGLAGIMTPQGGLTTDTATLVAAIIGVAPAVFRGHVAIETIIGLPQTTHLRATGQLATQSLAPTVLGLQTGIPPLGTNLGEAKAVPPLVTVVFRLPAIGPVVAFVGGGASVLFITDAKVTNPVLTQVATPKLDISPAVGLVGQAGVDIHLGGRFYARADVKEMWFQDTTSTITNIRVHTDIPDLETVDVGSVKATVSARPIIFQAGIGMNF